MGTSDYQRVAAAIAFLAQNAEQQPSLREVAEYVGLSPYHFQRLFLRWAGVSPKRYLQQLTLAQAKQRLACSETVLEAAHAVGLSGPGRLHDLFVTIEAMTPGEYREGGAGLQIGYGQQATPFGSCLLALTERGVCGLTFTDDARAEPPLQWLERQWPRADKVHAPHRTAALCREIFAPLVGAPVERPLSLHVRGTNFQLSVWRALLDIPPGAVVSYQRLAATLDRPKATRAVASAVARNPVAYLIPCHRVIRSSGHLAGYRWGLLRKRALLAREAL